MNTFVTNVGAERTTTTNGMEAFVGSLKATVDLFYQIGASRGRDVTPLFAKALQENREVALRLAQWARDVRGGAGERQIYRDILQYLEVRDPAAARALMYKTPEVGRWDDLLVFRYDEKLREEAFAFIHMALLAGDGLAAKWMPRKGKDAIALREYMGMSPKQYRKTLVGLTNVVETLMCAKAWDKIEFGKLPSLASTRYKGAFYRNAKEAYEAYAARLAKGTDKVNAGAVFPYQVLQGLMGVYGRPPSEAEGQVILSQWEALPDYMDGTNVLAMVDVSGSMTCPIGAGKSPTKVSCLEVAVSLGLYVADKNRGAFKDTFLTFSGSPELLHLKGNVLSKIDQMAQSSWAMNTDLMKAMDKILSHAKTFAVPAKDMPTMLLILSDMQFDACAKFGGSALEATRARFEAAGYELPKIVFWNLNSYDNVPARFNDQGVALISGFSPAVMQGVLKADFDRFTPEAIMLDTVMVDRYAI